MRTAIAVMSGCILLLFTGNQAISQDSYLDMDRVHRDDPSVVVNRPVNVQGLTGLIITNSAYTQRKGRIVAGLASIAENSDSPDFSILQGIATITAGITDRIEVGIRAQAFGTNLGSSATREVGVGDTDFLIKWRATSQGETLPAIALGLGYTLGTGNSDKGLSGVEHQSARLLVIGTSETEMPGDYFIGIYFEGQLVYSDRVLWSSPPSSSEKYGVINAGLLLPLSEDRRMQVLLEYNGVFKKDIPTVYEQNSQSFMPGLRYVTPNLNISVGVQFYDREDENAPDNVRYIGTLSYAF